MAGSLRAWALLGGMAGLATLQPTVGCGVEAGSPGNALADAEVVNDVLAAIGPSVILPTLDRFLVAMDALESALDALAAVGGVDGSERAQAQAYWAAAMATWQELEVMQIGPAGSSLSVIAGADLRDEIYSWPTVNDCRVDQVTADGDWATDDFFTSNLINAYGMDALEYVLHSGPDTQCPGQVPPVSDGSWDALGDPGVAETRAAMAQVLASEVNRQAMALRDAWSPDGDDFSDALVLGAGTPYASSEEALNAIFHAIFYLETMTKDVKLAKPLGISDDCGDSSCPEDVEGLWGGNGLAAIEANLLGFERVFTGGEGAGMDDLLVEVGHADLAEQILADLAAAMTAVEAVEGPLDEAITERNQQVQALYDAVKLVTDALKGDLATVLSLQIPSEASGDND